MNLFVISAVCCLIFTNYAAGSKTNAIEGTNKLNISPEADEENSENLICGINTKEHYLYAHNEAANDIAMLHYTHNLSTFYDGKTGAAFLFSYEDGEMVYIPDDVTSETWHVKQKNLDEYFRETVGPKKLFAIGEKQGYQFNTQLIPKNFAEKMAGYLSHYSTDYSSQCASVPTFLHISKLTSDDLKTYMHGFEQVFGNISSKVRGDFKWLVGIFQGMADFFACFDGGIDALNKKDIKLNLTRILNEETGFHVLIYLLEELNQHFDLGNILSGKFNSPVDFFDLVSKLAGDINYGFDGFTLVVSEIVSYKYNKNSKENLISVLEQYFNNSPRGRDDNIEGKWRSSVRDLQAIIKKLKLEHSFGDLTKLLQDISNNQWSVNNVDISAVLDVIMKNILPSSFVTDVISKLEDTAKERSL